MAEIDPREEKLPRWAQAALRKARHEKALAEDRLTEFTKTVEESPAYHFNHYENPIYFPATDSVTWRFGLSDTFDSITVRMENGGLSVRGGNAVVVKPESSNTVRIELRERF